MDKNINYFDLFKVNKYQAGGGITGDMIEQLFKNLNPNGTGKFAEFAGKATNFLNMDVDTSRNASVGQSLGTAAAEIAKNGFDWKNASVTGAVGSLANAALDKVTGAVIGDKTFNKQSSAIDDAVRTASTELQGRFPPWGLLAAGILEVSNAADKMAGKTVEGFEVGDLGAGYSGVESTYDAESFRGSQTKQMKEQTARRNEQAMAAIKAADVNEEQAFQQEARMNSIHNVIQNNAWALDGGVSTDLLAAKHGAKLVDRQQQLVDKIINTIFASDTVKSAKNGAKLKPVEISEEENVIPTGTLHKNKHNLDLEEITKKGIPVIQNVDDSVETFEEIKEHEKDIVQSAEIESLEIIFNKEVTDFIEEKMQNSSDKEVCKEVGMRLCKEILFNTKDKSDLIETINQKESDNE